MEVDECIMDVQMPPGFRFHPTGEEIITHYLVNKVMDTRFTSLPIGSEVDLNTCEPWDLPNCGRFKNESEADRGFCVDCAEKAKMGENEWYFFYQKGRKYARGRRTNRATKSGYWKATGKDKEIYKKGNKSCLVGMKKTLVFYIGRAPKGERSNWVMHEYRLQPNFSEYNLSKTAKEEWVVCRVFHKKSSNETSDHPGVEVAKPDSYVDLSPTLPQSKDYSRSPEILPTSSTFATKEEGQEDFKPNNISISKLISNNHNQIKTLHPDPNNFFSTTPYSDPINNPNLYHQIVHPNSFFPHHNSPMSSLVYSNQYPSNSDSRIFAPDSYTNITGEYESTDMGTYSSFNNSIISPSHNSTGLSDDLVKACDECLSFSTPSMPDFDSLWS